MSPDRDEARQLVEDELAEPTYNRPESIAEQVLGWIQDRISDFLGMLQSVSGVDGASTFVIAAVVLIALVSLWFAIRGRRRDQGLRAPTATVLDEPSMTAADYRERSSSARARGEWDEALLDSFRAIAADSAERTLLPGQAGLTATEIAVRRAEYNADHRRELLAIAATFDTVRYGQGHATQEQSAHAATLEATLAKAPVTQQSTTVASR